jgi:hypothetical protein
MLPVQSRHNMPSQLEYRHPYALRDVDQTNYGEFIRLDPIVPQFPSLVERERIRVALAFLNDKRQDKISISREEPLLFRKNEQETMVNKRLLFRFDLPGIDGEFPG